HRAAKRATAPVARTPGAKGAKAVKTAAPSPRRRGEGERSSGTKPAITPVIAPARKHARAAKTAAQTLHPAQELAPSAPGRAAKTAARRSSTTGEHAPAALTTMKAGKLATLSP